MTQITDPIEEEKNLEEKLKNIQEEKQELEAAGEVIDSQEVITKLEKESNENKEIAKKAQLDYINLKMDFDMLQRQSTQKIKDAEKENLIKIMKKILPTIDTLRTSLDHIPVDQKDTAFAQGILITYNKMIETLAGLGIHENPGIGSDVDSFLHEPMGMKPVDTDDQKGKIVEEYQKGYYYEKEGEKLVIITSKVIVGQ